MGPQVEFEAGIGESAGLSALSKLWLSLWCVTGGLEVRELMHGCAEARGVG